MLSEYSTFVKNYWKPAEVPPELVKVLYTSNCMVGEAGETADAVKKLIKGRGSKEDVVLEMGDTLYYLEALAQELGFTLEEVIIANRTKLDARFAKTGSYSN